MTDQLTPLAVQNAELLRAIGERHYGSLSELAGAADLAVNNLNRKLDSLIGEGLIVRDGDASHEVTLTALGERALAAISAFDAPPAGALLTVDPWLIEPNPWNPRTGIDAEADRELAESIRAVGILQRIIVRPHPATPGRYQQALGHRRVRAARMAGVDAPIEIRELTDDDMADIGIIENVQREDLHWIDEAEGYRMLADRGRSAAQIVRLVGTGGRKKRSIQELIQFARELDEPTKARCRLPDGDPQRISVDQARFMVGNKRPKPALDLTPKLAVTLLELLLDVDFAAEAARSGPIVVILQRKPIGGPLITLADRGLIKLITRAGAPAASIELSVDMSAWMTQVGFDDDRVGAVHKARAAVIGDLAAGALLADARFLTNELNPPEGAVAMADAATADEPDDDADYEDGGRFGFGSPDTLAAPEPEPVAQAAKPAPKVDARAGLILLEMAHKIARDARPGDPNPSAAVDPSYRHDAMSNQMVFDRLAMFIIQGARTATALTQPAIDWLEAQGLERDDAGLFLINDEALLFRQVEAGEAPQGLYVTPWLQAAVAAGALAQGVQPPRDAFAEQIREAIRDDGEAGYNRPSTAPVPILRATLSRLMAAGREARRIIQSAETHRLKPEDTAPVVALLDAAMGDAQRDLDRT